MSGKVYTLRLQLLEYWFALYLGKIPINHDVIALSLINWSRVVMILVQLCYLYRPSTTTAKEVLHTVT